MEELQNIKKQAGQDNSQVTLLGHSMGRIFLDEPLSLCGPEQDCEYDEIVYLAAACTIKDPENAVILY